MNTKLAQAFTGANQAQLAGLAQSVAKAYQPQVAGLAKVLEPQLAGLAQAATSAHQAQFARLAKVLEPQLAGLAQAATSAHQAQFARLNGLARSLHTMPITDAMILQIGNSIAELAKSEFQDVAPKRDSENRELRKLSDREVAAMMTIIVFLLVYFSYGLAIKYSSQIAQIAAIDGPSPFDAAIYAGALTFWACINHRRDS